jgi:AmiR/NasT family two-component response regulator
VTAARTRVLVCEDDTIIRLDLRTLLESAGMTVAGEAADGEEAVRLARELEPDLVVMDVKMPRLDGIAAARRMLAERPVPVVIVTAFAQREIAREAAEAGVFGYLVKPFRAEDVLPAIEAARARFAELEAVRAEAQGLADALAARRTVERAKGILMARDGLDEAEAYARLRSASQRTGRPMRELAEALLATAGTPSA